MQTRTYHERIQDRITSFAEKQGIVISRPGHDYIRTVIDPAHGANPLIPDLNGRPSTVATYETTQTITAPNGLADGATWDLLVCTLPGDFVHALALWGPSGSGGVNFNGDSTLNYTIFGGSVPAGYQPQALTCRGPGFSSLSPVTPGTVEFSTPTFPPAHAANMFRTVGQSITATFSGSTLNDGGTVFSAVSPQSQVKSRLTSYSADGHGFLSWNQDRTVSFSESDYNASQTLTYDTWAAKEGSYIIAHTYPGEYFTTPSTQYESFETDSGITGGGTILAGTRCSVVSGNPIAMRATYRTLSGEVIPMMYNLPNHDIALDDSDVRFSIFRGLHGTASVLVKSVKTVELCASGPSPFTPFLRRVEPDPAAMLVAKALALELKPAYPSRDNFLAAIPGLLAKAWPVAKQLLPYVPQAIELIRKAVKGASKPKTEQRKTTPAPPAKKSKRAPAKKRAVVSRKKL